MPLIRYVNPVPSFSIVVFESALAFRYDEYKGSTSTY